MSIEEEIQSRGFRTLSEKSFVNILFTSSFLNTKFIELMRPYNLTQPQYNILRILRGQNGLAILVNDIKSRMLSKSPNTSRTLAILNKRGLVLMEQDVVDKRQMLIRISKQGKELLRNIDALVDDFNRDVINLSVEEQVLLNNILDKIRLASRL